MGTLDRWAGCMGSWVVAASLALVAIADFGWFCIWLALAVVVATGVGPWLVWRPLIRFPSLPMRLRLNCILAVGVLLVGAALIAPGSESIVGPRDHGVYVATGFSIARWGSTSIADPGLQLLTGTIEPGH